MCSFGARPFSIHRRGTKCVSFTAYVDRATGEASNAGANAATVKKIEAPTMMKYAHERRKYREMSASDILMYFHDGTQ